MKREEARLRELGLWPPHGLQAGARARPARGVASPPASAPVDAPDAASRRVSASVAVPATGDWPALEAEIRACQACGLCRTRQQAVPGGGSRTAQLLVVGAAPGADEDSRGEPFVGVAGALLDQMLLAIGLHRREVYVTDVLKCRPPDDRQPSAEEVAACIPHLLQQIERLQPSLILALGDVAARALLGGDGRVDGWRGSELAFMGIPVVVSHHPAHLLQAPLDKSRAWEDLCRLDAQLAVRAASAAG